MTDETSDLLRERLKKLKAVEALGMDPFGGKFPKDAAIGAIVAGFEERKRARTAGRLSAVRLMGKTAFCDLKDETGRIQLFVKSETIGPEGLKLFEALDIGDILGAEGELFKTKTGEISIRVEKLTILAKSLRPLPEKWHGLKDVETRYRQRYLDLVANDEVKAIFKKRSLVIRSIRKTLDDKNYLEVETPMMHPIPGGAAGKPFKTHHESLDADLYLRVAPELYLKRLLVGGFDKVYEINKSFRNEGVSTRHNPEFTMLEVYTAYADVNDVMDLTGEIIQAAAAEAKTDADLSRWERVSFADLMKDSFGIKPDDPLEVWTEKLKKKGVGIEGKALSRTQLINIVGELLEPGAGRSKKESHPVFVTDYFTELCPLAKKNKSNPLLSERFELYIGGMEIANGYSELNNPIEQRERFLEDLREKGKEAASGEIDEDFLTALEYGMPPAGGLGIGVDRLVMVLTGQPSIRDVILFPQMKREK
ncbi:MAG: lysine--tRNA ligase [Candidatus Omnitrophica bacterium]|nr:lysine--tRNA ligase [Candidatus Omnitrophota bacterium]